VEDVVDTEESSSKVSCGGEVMLSILTSWQNIHGKSWNVAAENGISHNSISEPGGGGPNLSKQSVKSDSQDPLEALSVLLSVSSLSEVSEGFLHSSGGEPKRESADEAKLSVSGAVDSVIMSGWFPTG
jgi:hypothetical protein